MSGLILCTAIVVFESCLSCKSLEAHRSVLGTVEKGSLVAFSRKYACQSSVVIHG